MTRRTGQREDRRRRVLREESPPTSPQRKRKSNPDGRVFGDGAMADTQPRISDYAPQSKMAMFYLWALGIGAIGSVHSLFVLRKVTLQNFEVADTSWLELAGPQTLFQFVAVAMIFAAVGFAVFVTRLRRHKIDDYRGRYRIWYLIVAGLTIAAVDIVTQAHRAIQGLLQNYVTEPPFENPATWWVLAWGVLGGLLVLRALIDVRRSKLATSGLIVAATSLACSGLLYLEWFQIPAAESQLMATTATFLFGLQMIVFSLAAFARYIMLTAGGANVRRPAKTKERTASSKRTGIFKLPKFRRRKAKAKVDDDDDEDELDEDEDAMSEEEYEEAEAELMENEDLTKAERRKLKKELRKKRRRAA